MSTEPQVESPVEEKKYIPLSEIAKHNTPESPWMAINGKVYDVKNFMDQHPGGEEVMLENAGMDATGPFEDVGHSDNAIELLQDMYIGEGNPEELKIVQRKSSSGEDIEQGSSNSNLVMILCVLIAGAAYYYYKALQD